MSERVFRRLDEAIDRQISPLDMRRYEARLRELLYWDERDPCDASILPLVISHERHTAYERASACLCLRPQNTSATHPLERARARVCANVGFKRRA